MEINVKGRDTEVLSHFSNQLISNVLKITEPFKIDISLMFTKTENSVFVLSVTSMGIRKQFVLKIRRMGTLIGFEKEKQILDSLYRRNIVPQIILYHIQGDHLI